MELSTEEMRAILHPMKIVIAGGGEIGFLFARVLSKEHDLNIIESDPQFLEKFDEFDVQVIHGSPTNLTTLKEAQVDQADVLVACAHSDEVNIICCLAANQMSQARTFCFVNKEHYFSTFNGELGTKLKIDRLLWPEKLMAEDIARVISVPEAIDVEIIEHGLVKLLEFRLRKDHFCAGKLLKDLDLSKGTLAIAVFRKDELFIPGGNTQLLEGDKVMFIGFDSAMRKLEKRFSSKRSSQRHTITIIGGGNVGMLLAQNLEQLGQFDVQMFERSLERSQTLAQRFTAQTMVFHEDGSNIEVLKTHQIQNTGCLVTLTENDEKNLLISIMARHLGIPKIMTRVAKMQNIPLFEAAVPEIMIISKNQAILNVIREITSVGVAVESILEQGKAEILKITVPVGFPPQKVMEIRLPAGVIIATIQRHADILVPGGADLIKPGDVLRVFCAAGKAEDARQILAGLAPTPVAAKEA
jgi:trk system potassium uptake protein TrkA